MNNDHGDLFRTLFPRHPTPPAVTQPLPAIRSKRIDGVLYVRAEDVADALDSQAPAVNRRLIAKLRTAAS